MGNNKVWDKMIEIYGNPNDGYNYIFKQKQLDGTVKAWKESSDLVYERVLKDMKHHGLI